MKIVNGPRACTGVEVMARCAVCGKLFRTRLRRLRSGESVSCGSVKKDNFLKHLAGMVDRLPPEVIAACWTSMYTGLSRRKTAAKYHLEFAVVDEARRRYQAKLDALLDPENGTATELYRMTTEPVDGKYLSITEAAAAMEQMKLPIEALQYLIKAVHHREATAEMYVEWTKEEAAWIASEAAKVVAMVAEESAFGLWKPSIRPWRKELTNEELKRREGKLLGKLAPQYKRCKEVDRSLLNDEQVARVDAFLDLADNTLQARLNRQARSLRSMNSRNQSAQSGGYTRTRAAA